MTWDEVFDIDEYYASVAYNLSKEYGYECKKSTKVMYNESDCEQCFEQSYEHWTFLNPPSDKIIIPLVMEKVSKYEHLRQMRMYHGG